MLRRWRSRSRNESKLIEGIFLMGFQIYILTEGAHLV